jgi:hypothetical protein
MNGSFSRAVASNGGVPVLEVDDEHARWMLRPPASPRKAIAR